MCFKTLVLKAHIKCSDFSGVSYYIRTEEMFVDLPLPHHSVYSEGNYEQQPSGK